MLSAENIQRTPWLAPVSFELESGALLLVSGASGSGKSLLLRALADLDAHDGEIRLEARTQQQTPPSEWRRNVMYFAAETAWWHETVRDHFQVALKNDQAWLFSALTQLRLTRSILDQEVMALSSGEKQRLALLRGMQFHPQVLLLDEVSANLDPEATLAMEQLLIDYLKTQQACALWVTHMPSQIERLKTSDLKIAQLTLAPSQAKD